VALSSSKAKRKTAPVADGDTSPPEKKLTDKERLFIAEYGVDLNGTRAAIRAGYSEHSAAQIASDTLRKPYIRAAIDVYLKEQMMSAGEVLRRLSDQAAGTMEDFIDPGSVSVDLERARANGKLHLIKDLEYTVTHGKDDFTSETVKFKLYDAQAALEKLGRYWKLFADRLDVHINLDDLTDEQLAALAAGKKP
jgi:phage terminase small subunit